jgi:P22_AR N-terminal domain
MSDEPLRNVPVPADSPYREIQFDGDQILTVRLEHEGVAVPVRMMCQVLRLDVTSQSERLQAHEVLSRGLRIVRVRQGGQLRSVVALLHRYIPFWLATISPHQVGEDVQPKLVRYQTELVDVLAAIYGGNWQPAPPTSADPAVAALQQALAQALTDLRLTREALLAIQQEQQEQGQQIVDHQEHLGIHDSQIAQFEGMMDDVMERFATHTTITGPQQEALSRAIRHLAARYKKRTGKEIFGKLFGEFCMHFGTPKYGLLPSGKYEEAIAWVQARAAELLPDDPDAQPPMQEALL